MHCTYMHRACAGMWLQVRQRNLRSYNIQLKIEMKITASFNNEWLMENICNSGKPRMLCRMQ